MDAAPFQLEITTDSPERLSASVLFASCDGLVAAMSRCDCIYVDTTGTGAVIADMAESAGIKITRFRRGCSVTEVAANYPAVTEYIKSMEDRLARITNHYAILRADLVEREARDLYGGFQAAANYKDLETCRTIANARLRGKCLYCEGRGEIGGQFPDGSYQTDRCPNCEGNGFVEIPELPSDTESGTHNA